MICKNTVCPSEIINDQQIEPGTGIAAVNQISLLHSRWEIQWSKWNPTKAIFLFFQPEIT